MLTLPHMIVACDTRWYESANDHRHDHMEGRTKQAQPLRLGLKQKHIIGEIETTFKI